jgi:hypothetical protein
VTANGGEIDAFSRRRSRTLVSIRLQQPTRRRRTSQLATMSKSTVLVIDDEPIFASSCAAFEFEGFTVREARTRAGPFGRRRCNHPIS